MGNWPDSPPGSHFSKILSVTWSSVCCLGCSTGIRDSDQLWHCLSWRGTLRKTVKNIHIAIHEQGAEWCPITIHPIHEAADKDLASLLFWGRPMAFLMKRGK